MQDLIELICNVKAMEEAVMEMQYDAKKAPLGEKGGGENIDVFPTEVLFVGEMTHLFSRAVLKIVAYIFVMRVARELSPLHSE